MNLKIIFSDFDGTLTHGSSLGPSIFSIIELIKKNKAELVIVTGRSLSWAHFLLSHFDDLDCVISEGGGVISYMDESGHIRDDLQVSEQDLKDLESFVELYKKTFSIPLTADSLGRKTDRAIELSDLGEEKAKIERLMDEHDIGHSCSNVHLNFWKGDISKAQASQEFLSKHRTHVDEYECLYFGDSLNDESMFQWCKSSVGVSNINEILDQLTHKPSVILHGEMFEGPKGVLNHLKQIWPK